MITAQDQSAENPAVPATLSPEQQLERALAAHKCRREWVWVNGQMTDSVRCMTCGVVTDAVKNRWPGQ